MQTQVYMEVEVEVEVASGACIVVHVLLITAALLNDVDGVRGAGSAHLELNYSAKS